jgi:hypothetical protein
MTACPTVGVTLVTRTAPGSNTIEPSGSLCVAGEPYRSTTGRPLIAYRVCPREITWPTDGSFVNVEVCPYTVSDERAVDKLDCALASCFSAEETWERSALTFAVVPVALCWAAETACTSLEHELPPLGELFSLEGEELAEAASAAPLPAQSTDSFARAADTVAW